MLVTGGTDVYIWHRNNEERNVSTFNLLFEGNEFYLI